MKTIDELKVFLNLEDSRYLAGKLAFYNRQYYFEYDSHFLQNKLEISPFALPLKTGVAYEKDMVFGGLFGVFNDSLPDGWGLLLLHRRLQQAGIDLRTLSSLDILSIIGCDGMGALEYEPINGFISKLFDNYSLDLISKESGKILEGESSDIIDFILQKSGSSCGARPKIMALVSDDKKYILFTDKWRRSCSHWLIKFQSSMDSKDAGVIEYVYSLAARECGIDMPETYLFESKECSGYFGVKRFDRIDNQKLHTHSACGLLNADFRFPSLDYENLLMATKYLTKNATEVEKMFRIMVFNIKAHNLDDHSKNFSFFMNEKGEWKVAPAYDLTYSSGIHSQRMTSVCGKTKNITDDDILKTAQKCGISKQVANDVIQKISESISEIPKTLRQIGVKFIL